MATRPGERSAALLVVATLGFALMSAAGATARGAGWAAAAHGLDGSAAPGHMALAHLAGLLPIGELAFRMAMVSALAMAAAAWAAAALARTLVPSERTASIAAAILTVASPVIQMNATDVGPHAPAAALLAWALVLAVRVVRAPAEAPRDLVVAGLLCGCAATMEPVLAAAVAVPALVPAARACGVRWTGWAALAAALPLGAYAATGLPTAEVAGGGAGARLAEHALTAGEGLGLGLLFGGLIGLCLGAATGLRGAGMVLAALASALAAAALQPGREPVDAAALPVVLLAAGLAPMTGAALRMLPGALSPRMRPLAAAAVLVPVASLGLAGATVRAGDSGFRRGDDVTRAAVESLAELAPRAVTPALPGRARAAIEYEHRVAGQRPDVELGSRAAHTADTGPLAPAPAGK